MMPPTRLAKMSSIVSFVAPSSAIFHALIIGEVDVVEDRPYQRRLNALNVHDQIGEREPEEAVRHDHRRHRWQI